MTAEQAAATAVVTGLAIAGTASAVLAFARARHRAKHVRNLLEADLEPVPGEKADLPLTRALATAYVRHLVEITRREGLRYRSPITIDQMRVWRWSSQPDGPTAATRTVTIEYRDGEVATLHLGDGTRTTVPVPPEGRPWARTGKFVLIRAEFFEKRRVELFEGPAVEEWIDSPNPDRPHRTGRRVKRRRLRTGV